MVIRNNVVALRNLFAQHARVALVADGVTEVEQYQLAQLYAQTYRQNYSQVLWLDASSRPLFRLSCQQQCVKLGLAVQHDPEQELQHWINQHAQLLLIVEHVSDPQLLSGLQDRANHFLFCSNLPSWPSQTLDAGLMRLHENQTIAPDNDRLACALAHNSQALQLAQAWLQSRRQQGLSESEARNACLQALKGVAKLNPRAPAHEGSRIPRALRHAYLLNLSALSAGARHLLGIFAWFGPQALPWQFFLQGDQSASWQARVQELINLQFCQAGGLANPEGGIWPTLEFSPSIQYLQRALGDPNDAFCAQQTIQDVLSSAKLPKALLPLFASHLEYLLAQQKHSPDQAALLLQLLEQHYQHQLHESEVLLRRILALRTENRSPDAEALDCQNLLAQNLKTQGRLDEAQQLLFSALSMARQHLGESAPQTSIYLNNLARLFALRGQHLAAIELEQQALSILRRALGDAHPQVLAVMHNLAHSLSQVPATPEVEALLQELVQIHLRLFGECDWRTQAMMDLLAGNLFAQNKLKQAASWLEKVHAVRKSLFGARHVETTIAAYDLMCIWCELENAGAASQVFHDSLAWLLTTPLNRVCEQQAQIAQLLQDFLPYVNGAAHEAFTMPASTLLH
ncbi:tetratricopeptide repeat protein [Massilia sp. W12]|uniref:tetratricopeptide repeat protein n=1 Tax=Massilia sp. W12 TaxID=3126507 RepID=UPI0030D4716C